MLARLPIRAGRGVDAPADFVARVGGTNLLVVALELLRIRAGSARAHIIHGASVAVIARLAVRFIHVNAPLPRIAAIYGAGVAVIADRRIGHAFGLQSVADTPCGEMIVVARVLQINYTFCIRS